MDKRARQTRKAKQIIKSKMNGRTQISVANELGVVSAHIYRLMKQDYLSPTLRQAMIDAGWLIIKKRNPRISIQRDDPIAAADSIINLAGREVSLALAKEILNRHYPWMTKIKIESRYKDCSPEDVGIFFRKD